MFTSIEEIYGSGFGGGDLGRYNVTEETMKNASSVDAILKIGLFWQRKRDMSYTFVLDEELTAIKKEFPKETTEPGWIESKDHARFLWGFTIGRRDAVLFKQGKITEDELYYEE